MALEPFSFWERYDTGDLKRVIVIWGGYIGTISLAQVATVLGILSTALLIVYTGLQIYVLWHDKIARRKRRHDEDSRPPAPPSE